MRLAALLLVACSSPSPKTPVAQGRAQPIAIGKLEAYVLEIGHLDVPNDGMLLGFGRPPSDTAAVLAAAGLPRKTIGLDIQCLLVKADGRVILIDTGTPDGLLQQSLARANVQPSAVTDIFISHAHTDHVGGLVTKTGALAFPAATIHMSAPEWASLQPENDEDRAFIETIKPKVVPFEPGAQVLPAVKAVATPGHTPGHSSYQIGDLFYLGDVAHHSVISVQHPTWSIAVDNDHAGAEAMRQQTLARLAADHTRVFAVHFPFPGVGHVVAQDEGLVWKAD
jgi:glyoxylase-like metal-dependent hydrolase (beta-lactamase superfamily II)